MNTNKRLEGLERALNKERLRELKELKNAYSIACQKYFSPLTDEELQSLIDWKEGEERSPKLEYYWARMTVFHEPLAIAFFGKCEFEDLKILYTRPNELKEAQRNVSMVLDN